MLQLVHVHCLSFIVASCVQQADRKRQPCSVQRCTR